MLDEPTVILNEIPKPLVDPIVRAAYRKHGRGKAIREAVMLVLKDNRGSSAMNEEDATV